MRNDQYHTRETIDGQEVDVANVGNTPGRVGLRSYICEECRLAFKADKVTFFRGKVYGVPCGCYRDISSILRRERTERLRSMRDYENDRR